MGFDVLEVPTADFADKSRGYFTEMRRIAEDKGITLTGGYGPSMENDIGASEPSRVEQALEYYKRMFGQMELAGISILGGALYSYWPVQFNNDFDKSADFERSVVGMQRLADIAANHGIVLNMEALNRFEGYLINTCQECVRYVDSVNKPNVKVMLDTFHMNIEEDSLTDSIVVAGSRLGHFHVGEANRKPPRPGRMPWKDIGMALRDIGYEGYVVMEPFVVPGGGVGKDIHVWRSLFPEVSDDYLDKQAAASLKYLKRQFE